MTFFAAFLTFGALFYAQSSFWETFFHEYVLDIQPKHRHWLFRVHKWLPAFWTVHVDHGVLHHYQTYRRSYVEQFQGEGEEEKLVEILRKQFDQSSVDIFVRSRFGTSFTREGVLPYSVPILLNMAWLPFQHSPETFLACLGANATFATPYFIFSMWVHRYMHMRYELAVERAPLWVRWILMSKYGIAVRISHFVHHRWPSYNYNLQYGADRLRGRWRPPSKAEWSEMVALGLIRQGHREMFEGKAFWFHPF